MEARKRSRVRQVLNNASSGFSQRFVFFGRKSSIHGLNHLFRERQLLVSRLFWIVILLISSGCLYMILVPVVELGDQVNFIPETRYLPWVTTFPAVTVCEAYNARMNMKKFVALYPDLMEPLNYDFRKYLTELIYGRGTCSKSHCVPCGSEVPCDLPWREVIEKVHNDCNGMITDCRIDDQEFACCKKFRLVDSEYGYCFSFNTLQSEYSSDDPLYTVNRTTGPGVLTFRVQSDAQVSVHSPEELATNVLDSKFKFDVKTRTHNRVQFLFSIVEMENDPMLLTEDVEVRGCRQLHEIPEGPLHTYKVYSYDACRLAVDTEHLFHHCQCVHPVRHISYQKLYCNYTGLNCLIMTEDKKQKLGVDSSDQEESSECLPSCVESELTTIHISRRWVDEEDKTGTLVTIQMAALPTLRYIRNLVRTDLDFVVSVGGMVSLFFAASILSIVEIFYLIFRPHKT